MADEESHPAATVSQSGTTAEQSPAPAPNPGARTGTARSARAHKPVPSGTPEGPGVKGMFKFHNDERGDQFNLRPRDDRSGAIPEDQRKISYELYEARNVLKLLQEEGAFKSDDKAKGDTTPGVKSYDEFIARLTQAAEVGCVSENVDTALALKALEPIRIAIYRRKGRHITYNYLLTLGLCGIGGIIFVLLLGGVLIQFTRLKGLDGVEL